jgi:signal transduction histidine kinase
MSKTFLLWSLTLFLTANASSQNNFPPVYEIKTDTFSYDTLDNTYWQVLEDKEGKYLFNDIVSAHIANKFHYNADKILQLDDLKIHGYWIRFGLKNSTSHDLTICLGDVDIPSSEGSDFYVIDDNNQMTHYNNGFLTSWNKLNGIKEFRLVPIMIKQDQKVIIYRRIFMSYHFYHPNTILTGFHSAADIYLMSQKRYFGAIHNIFIFGVLAFASLFIFFFFIMVHEKVYLYFALYLFVLGVGRFNTNAEMYDVFFRDHPFAFSYFINSFWVFPDIFLILFIRSLLNTKYLLPRWDKFLIILTVTYSISWLLHLIIKFSFVGNNVTGSLVAIQAALLEICIPITFVLSVQSIKFDKELLMLVLPLQSAWGLLRGILSITDWLAGDYNVYKYKILFLLKNNWYGLETILLIALTISFSWILLKRFGELKKQLLQKEFEKEIERARLIEEQKAELEKTVEQRTYELKHSLQDLKSTQAQLIQQEKMASLGELTAGIAHEIQNPLNFVNNFSDVNRELLSEMKGEIKKGNYDDVDSIASNVIDNEEKINRHGKRADEIVKGMLQHSRSSSGQKELTNINALCDEYLRLAYHGLRAKDKSFNAKFETDFDPSIGKINIVPQEIGRVILNLINNAFYAVNEKAKQNISGYKPIVIVSTKTVKPPSGGLAAKISVIDNGGGIPQNIIDKIFQPFFTTKPTGQGTGLGLSLSYDIITKGHGGTLKAVTKEGEGSEFIIEIPIT